MDIFKCIELRPRVSLQCVHTQGGSWSDGCHAESHWQEMLIEGTIVFTIPQWFVFKWNDFPRGHLYSRTVSYDHVLLGS